MFWTWRQFPRPNQPIKAADLVRTKPATFQRFRQWRDPDLNRCELALPFWSRRSGYGTRIGVFLTASRVHVSAAVGERKREDDADPLAVASSSARRRCLSANGEVLVAGEEQVLAALSVPCGCACVPLTGSGCSGRRLLQRKRGPRRQLGARVDHAAAG